jgi:tetraacyldisaccharide 4'-kinase
LSPPADVLAVLGASLLRSWYAPAGWTRWLAPLAGVFRLGVTARRALLRSRFQGKPLSAPVIVVGNITVGGTGKTPLIIALAEQLVIAGLRPGIISRGYGGHGNRQPLRVTASSSPTQVGDEPLLIARATGCPVVVDTDRRRAAEFLLAQTDTNLILSDDGLQHYRLHRDVEIVVVDGERGVGNGYCLPAGPLREPIRRLASVDMVVVNGSGFRPPQGSMSPAPRCFTMELAPMHFRHLASGALMAPDAWHGPREVHAVAGIGNPARFAATLTALGLAPHLHAFPDHHRFRAADLEFGDGLPLVMTAKDAVKCAKFAGPDTWVLDVSAQLPAEMLTLLLARIHPLPPFSRR